LLVDFLFNVADDALVMLANLLGSGWLGRFIS